MPPVRRTIAVLCALAALSPAAAVAQSGDEQYTDPFEDSGQTEQPSRTTDDLAPITPAPQGGGGGGSSTPSAPSTPAPAPPSGTSGTAGATATPSAASGDELPNTGMDARGLVLLGAAMLLTGAGLRLRTTPEQF